MTTPTVDIELRNPTQVGLPALQDLAYSQESPPAVVEPLVEYEPWRPVIHRSAARVLIGVFVALVVGATGFLATNTSNSVASDGRTMVTPGSSLVAQPPPIGSVPSTLAGVPDVLHVDPDTVFLNGVAATVTGFTVDTPALVIPLAHEQCASLAAGHTVGEVAAGFRRDYSGVTPADSVAFVRAAIAAYCPQYTGK